MPEWRDDDGLAETDAVGQAAALAMIKSGLVA